MKDSNRFCLSNDASQKFLLKVVSSPKSWIHERLSSAFSNQTAIRLVRLVDMVRHVTEDARKDEELRELNRRFEE